MRLLYLCMGFSTKSNYLVDLNDMLLWLKVHAEAGWKKKEKPWSPLLWFQNSSFIFLKKRNRFNRNSWQFARWCDAVYGYSGLLLLGLRWHMISPPLLIDMIWCIFLTAIWLTPRGSSRFYLFLKATKAHSVSRGIALLFLGPRR